MGVQIKENQRPGEAAEAIPGEKLLPQHGPPVQEADLRLLPGAAGGLLQDLKELQEGHREARVQEDVAVGKYHSF